jgi:hypothetical protein
MRGAAARGSWEAKPDGGWAGPPKVSSIWPHPPDYLNDHTGTARVVRSLQGSSIAGLPLGAGLLLVGAGARVDFGLEAIALIQVE